MREKIFIGIIAGISIVAASFPVYNYYYLPVIRHQEIMNKIETFDERLKKIENAKK
jgi:hypothetical protein